MTTIVCIHGRGQQGQNPDNLRNSWAASLNVGLALANRPQVTAEDIVFPYYGDQLEAARINAIQSGSDIQLAATLEQQRMDPAMPNDIAELESDLLKSLSQQSGLTEDQFDGFGDFVLLVPGARKILKAIADNTGVDQAVIKSFLTDVAVYLRRARAEVLDLVRRALPPAPERLVIIAHSLGSLVAHDLLQDKSIAERTDLLVTAGSPLGIEACHRNLLAGGPNHPGVPAWVTAYDPQDIVTLGHPLAPLYGQPLVDLQADNPLLKAHSITEYLKHREVAAPIGDVIARTPAQTQAIAVPITVPAAADIVTS